ncbi:MAG: hypothetical protein KKF30_10700 [Proteobacteria bacterium]|nr:hypothetical protein [Pseudomonadota bacterium]MBU4470362.1 hypothetical protein [Pseudomonadota bacterium]MCG2752773.1 hypothetical protein [Desulfobacteraceae bacterium]
MKKQRTFVLIACLISLFLINGHVFAFETPGRIESTEKSSYLINTTSEIKAGVVTLGGEYKELG